MFPLLKYEFRMKNLKNILWLCLLGLLLAALPATAGQVVVSTPSFSLVLDAPVGGELKYLYYGNKLSAADLLQMDVASTCHHVAYPSYGIGWPGEPALRVKHADGVIATRLHVQEVEVRQEQDAVLTQVKLKDRVYPFYVNLCYKAYREVDVIETWTETQSYGEGSGNVAAICFVLSPSPQGRCMALQSLWRLGKRGTIASRALEARHPVDKEYRRGA